MHSAHATKLDRDRAAYRPHAAPCRARLGGLFRRARQDGEALLIGVAKVVLCTMLKIAQSALCAILQFLSVGW